MAEREPEQLVEDRSRVFGAGIRDLPLGPEEPLDTSGGDLTERVLLEHRADVQTKVVTVVLLGVALDVPQLQVGEPQFDEIIERT